MKTKVVKKGLVFFLIFAFMLSLLQMQMASAITTTDTTNWTVSSGNTHSGNVFISGNGNMSVTSGVERYDFNSGATMDFTIDNMDDTGNSWRTYLDIYIINKKDNRNQNIHFVLGKNSIPGYPFTLVLKNASNANLSNKSIKNPVGDKLSLSVSKKNGIWNFNFNGALLTATDAQLGYLSELDMSSSMIQVDLINGSGHSGQITINEIKNTIQEWKTNTDTSYISGNKATSIGTPSSMTSLNRYNFNNGMTFEFDIVQSPDSLGWANYFDLYIINDGQYIKLTIAKAVDIGMDYTVVLTKSVGPGNVKSKGFKGNFLGRHSVSYKKVANEWEIVFDGFLLNATDDELGFTSVSDLGNAYIQLDMITTNGSTFPIVEAGNTSLDFPDNDNSVWTSKNANLSDNLFSNSSFGSTAIISSVARDYNIADGLSLDFDIAKMGFTGETWLNQMEIGFVNSDNRGVKIVIGNYEGDQGRISDPLTVGVQTYGKTGIKTGTAIINKVNTSHRLSIIESENEHLIIGFDTFVFRISLEEMGLTGADLSNCSIEIKNHADYDNKPEIKLSTPLRSAQTYDNNDWIISSGNLTETSSGLKINNVLNGMDPTLISKETYNANGGISLDFSIDKIGKTGDEWQDYMSIEISNKAKSGIVISMGEGDDANKPFVNVARKIVNGENLMSSTAVIENYANVLGRHSVSLYKFENGYWTVNIDNILSKPFEMNEIDMTEVSITINLKTKTFAQYTLFNVKNSASLEISKGIFSVNSTPKEKKEDGTVLYTVSDNRQRYQSDSNYHYFMREKLPSIYGYDVTKPITIRAQFLRPAGPYIGIEINSIFGDFILDNALTQGPALLWITGSKAMYADKTISDGYYNESKYYTNFMTNWVEMEYTDKGCLDEVIIDIGTNSSKFYINGTLISEDKNLKRSDFATGKAYINFLFFADSVTAPKSTLFALAGINSPKVDANKMFVDKSKLSDLEFTVNAYDTFIVRINSNNLVINKDYSYNNETKKLVVKKEYISKLVIGKYNLIMENKFGSDSVELIVADTSEFSKDIQSGKETGEIIKIKSFVEKMVEIPASETPKQTIPVNLYAIIIGMLVLFAGTFIVILLIKKKKLKLK